MRNRLLLLGAALAAFGASLFSGFHFDDYGIFSDPVLTSPTGWKAIWAWPRTQPLTNLTYRLNYQIGGRDPFTYHLIAVALFLCAVLLAYECLRRLLPERAALAAAAVFALHPMQAEAANYVSARADLLAAIFCFAALLCWLTNRRWLALPCFVAALLSSEYSLAFPLVLLLCRGRACPTPAPEKESALARWLNRTPTFAICALSLAALARLVHALRLSHVLPTPWKYFLAQGPALWRYLTLLAIPYGFTIDPDVRVPAVWFGAFLWAALLAAALLAWRQRRAQWTLWLFIGLLLLIPASSVLPQPNLYADHRTFLPMFAFAAAAGLLLTRVKANALAVTVVTVLALLSVVRTAVWFNDKTLWQEAVRRAPAKVRPKIQLSRNLPAADALDLLQRAQNQDPRDPAVPAEMGKVLLQERQIDPALIEFGEALALDPSSPEYLTDRGVALYMSGLTEQARTDFERALDIDPNYAAAIENLRKFPPAP
jgi:tetratricopeptide (TPR) repeat protein